MFQDKPPDLTGLPLWAQGAMALTIAFLAAYRGYLWLAAAQGFHRQKRQGEIDSATSGMRQRVEGAEAVIALKDKHIAELEAEILRKVKRIEFLEQKDDERDELERETNKRMFQLLGELEEVKRRLDAAERRGPPA